ncbi:MAG: amino acid permease [Acidimicrobiales bacterium]
MSDESLQIPETLSYRIKNRLLGPPLNTDQLATERLGNVVALGVLAPDCISSSAYGSEEILRILVPVVGVAAFSLVVPITAAILAVLILVTLSYREVVQVYTRAGGSYVVARDNFGPNVAQISAVALLIDYTVTVAVQTAAGTAALVSAIPSTSDYQTEISVAVVVLLCYGNLRGIREAGKTFAFPTYFFILAMGVMIVWGLIKSAEGTLPVLSLHRSGAVPIGHPGSGLFAGAGLFFILQAYANGGSSLTGLEAISNGVSTFRRPEGTNARRVLIVMSTTLGCLVLGVSLLAHFSHTVPFVAGAPTVIAQEARTVFGAGLFGRTLFYLFQLAGLLVLWTGANTSFNGFPFLASFVAGDSFLPRQLTKRGHRLVFSNGIIVLAVVAIALLVATRSNVDFLIAFYAIGVFTGFTMAGAGMVKHHLDHRQPRWRLKLAVNGSAAIVSAAVVLIFASTKFLQGAWVVVVAFPILLVTLIRLNRRYRREQQRLEEGALQAAEVRALRRHVVLVFVDRLDLAAARAIQYARTLTLDELRAVHFVLDRRAAEDLRERWESLGIPKAATLELRDCPSRRLVRDALVVVAEALADNETEVSVLLPRRAYTSGWSRILHDRTADRIAGEVSRLPHANATIVPFHMEDDPLLRRPDDGSGPGEVHPAPITPHRQDGHRSPTPAHLPGTASIAELRWRQRAKVAGRVQSVQVQPSVDTPRLIATIEDTSGKLTLVFGRRNVAGMTTGTRLLAEGVIGEEAGRLMMLNPLIELLAPAGDDTYDL